MQYGSSERVPHVNIYYIYAPWGCRRMTGEGRVPLSPGAAPSARRAQLVLVLARGLGLGLSRPPALFEGSLEFSLLAESEVSMKHAHISKVWSEASRRSLLTRMQRI